MFWRTRSRVRDASVASSSIRSVPSTSVSARSSRASFRGRSVQRTDATTDGCLDALIRRERQCSLRPRRRRVVQGLTSRGLSTPSSTRAVTGGERDSVTFRSVSSSSSKGLTTTTTPVFQEGALRREPKARRYEAEEKVDMDGEAGATSQPTRDARRSREALPGVAGEVVAARAPVFDRFPEIPRNLADVKIFYVDDGAIQQRMLQIGLSSSGVNVSGKREDIHKIDPKVEDVIVNGNITITGNGNFALEHLMQPDVLAQYHIILFDFCLGERGLDGPDVFKRLKAATDKEGYYRTICLSYSTGEDSVEEGLGIGMDGGIVKGGGTAAKLPSLFERLLKKRYPRYEIAPEGSSASAASST